MFLPTNITLKLGDSGDFVTELQRRLSQVHCFGADAINGFFDGNTVNGVSQFQSMSGIRADGIAGPETLRRLNGVISGDSSEPIDTHAAEEEARQQQQAAMLRQQLEEQQLAQQHQWEQQQATLSEPQHAPTTEYAAPTYTAPPAAAPHEHQPQVSSAAPQPHQPLPVQQNPEYYAQQNATHATAAAPATGDHMLGQMLAAQQQQQQRAQPAEYAAPPQPAAQQLAAPLAQPPQQVHMPASQVPAMPGQPAPAAAVPAQPPEQQPQTAPEARGVVGRAVQYANAMVQKLANYFESKLPNHVIAEVKEIGHIMANSGVKEAAIPSGPEQQRGVDAPARSQQQGKQIG